MMKLFERTDLGLLNSYFGMPMIQIGDKINLKVFSLMNCNPIEPPDDVRPNFRHKENEKTGSSSTYRSLIGYLTYLTHTRLDSMFPVGFLSCFMDNPTYKLMKVGRCVVKHIRGILI